jgi:hypothetical protein
LAVEIVAATARSKLQEANIDATLKALQDKQCSLKLKRITQFGELVTATSGDGLDLETRRCAPPRGRTRQGRSERKGGMAAAGPELLSPRTTSEGERRRSRCSDTRTGMQARRARTRRLIELGGLVHKSGLADHLANYRAALMGALVLAVETLTTADANCSPTEIITHWRAVGRAALTPLIQPTQSSFSDTAGA